MKNYRGKKSRVSFDAGDFFDTISKLSQVALSGSFSISCLSNDNNSGGKLKNALPALERSNANDSYNSRRSGNSSSVDFTEEAKKILLSNRLNLGVIGSDNSKKSNNLDAVWKSCDTTSIIYCGNYHIASDLNMLRKHNIGFVINCTRPSPSGGELPNYFQNVANASIEYYSFPIATWQSSINHSRNRNQLLPDVLTFFYSLFTFIRKAISTGKSILIHCLAGCHRAGATSVATLMHFADISLSEAIACAKACRPIVDPTIGCLSELLTLFENERMKQIDIDKTEMLLGRINQARRRATILDTKSATITAAASVAALFDKNERKGEYRGTSKQLTEDDSEKIMKHPSRNMIETRAPGSGVYTIRRQRSKRLTY